MTDQAKRLRSAVSLFTLAMVAAGMTLGTNGIVSDSHAHAVSKSHTQKLAPGEELLCEFAPENDLQIPETGLEFAGSGIDEKTFNRILDRISEFMSRSLKRKVESFKSTASGLTIL